MNNYYTAIADDYDDFYEEEVLQDDLDAIQETVAELFDGHDVLELGCGTGHWTDTLSYVAKSVHAIDINEAMLEWARDRDLDPDVVTFEQRDCWDLPDDIKGKYTAVLAAGFWSHVPKEDQEKFLKMLKAKLGTEVVLMLIDDNFVEGETLPIAKTDLEGNTYLIPSDADGERYEVLKNFPADSALKKRFANHGKEVRIKRYDYFWTLTCRLK